MNLQCDAECAIAAVLERAREHLKLERDVTYFPWEKEGDFAAHIFAELAKLKYHGQFLVEPLEGTNTCVLHAEFRAKLLDKKPTKGRSQSIDLVLIKPESYKDNSRAGVKPLGVIEVKRNFLQNPDQFKKDLDVFRKVKRDHSKAFCIYPILYYGGPGLTRRERNYQTQNLKLVWKARKDFTFMYIDFEAARVRKNELPKGSRTIRT